MRSSPSRLARQLRPGTLWVSTLYAYGPLHRRKGGVTIAPDQLLPPEYLDSSGHPAPGPVGGEGLYKRSGNLSNHGVWFYEWVTPGTP